MSNLNSQIVDIINNFLKENKLVDARTCEGEFLGMHSSLTVGGAHEVVEELEKLIAQQVREAKIEAFDIAFDSHDYDRIREMKTELQAQLQKDSKDEY